VAAERKLLASKRKTQVGNVGIEPRSLRVTAGGARWIKAAQAKLRRSPRPSPNSAEGGGDARPLPSQRLMWRAKSEMPGNEGAWSEQFAATRRRALGVVRVRGGPPLPRAGAGARGPLILPSLFARSHGACRLLGCARALRGREAAGKVVLDYSEGL
jgi:hypothetical protein